MKMTINNIEYECDRYSKVMSLMIDLFKGGNASRAYHVIDKCRSNFHLEEMNIEHFHYMQAVKFFIHPESHTESIL